MITMVYHSHCQGELSAMAIRMSPLAESVRSKTLQRQLRSLTLTVSDPPVESVCKILRKQAAI